MTEAHAVTEGGRNVLITQEADGGDLEYWVADDRFTDGWRKVEDPDELADLIGSINAAQAAKAEDSTGGGADDPEGDAPGGEATPTAGTTPDHEE